MSEPRTPCMHPEQGLTPNNQVTYSQNQFYQALLETDMKTLSDIFLSKQFGVNDVFTETSNVSCHGLTPLHVAVCQQNKTLCNFLLENGSDVNRAASCLEFDGKKSRVKIRIFKDKLQWTTLFRAICMQDFDIVTMLVEGGADVNVYDQSCCSALWHAVDTNNVGLASAVIRGKDCDINTQDRFNMAPIHIAATHCNHAMISKLLDNGAIVDKKQLQGATALHLSCSAGDFHSTRLLLQHGADPNIIDTDGFTALFLALEKSQQACIAYALIEAGSFVSSSTIFYTVHNISLLKSNLELNSMVNHLIDSPRSLKVLSSLALKSFLRKNTKGRSIYNELGKFQIPLCLISYLQLSYS